MVSFTFHRTGGIVAAPGLSVHARVELSGSREGAVLVDGRRVRALEPGEAAMLARELSAHAEAGTPPRGATSSAPGTGARDHYHFAFEVTRVDGSLAHFAGDVAPRDLVAWASREADALIAARFGAREP